MPNLLRRVERLPLERIGALMLGGAAAFFLWAMPIALLERGVMASGLGELVPAMVPPLGDMVRGMLIVAGALVAGAFAWGAMAIAGGRVAVAAPAVVEDDLLILRLGDIHPGMPACRPIRAARELGELEAEAVAERLHPPSDGMSIAEMLARLEQGIERLAATVEPAPAEKTSHGSPRSYYPDMALREAARELRTLAGGGR